jgi:hypothetical protein
MADNATPKTDAAHAAFLAALADKLDALADLEAAIEERITTRTAALVSSAEAARSLGSDKKPKGRKAPAN